MGLYCQRSLLGLKRSRILAKLLTLLCPTASSERHQLRVGHDFACPGGTYDKQCSSVAPSNEELELHISYMLIETWIGTRVSILPCLQGLSRHP